MAKAKSDAEDLTDRIYEEWMRTSRVRMEFLLDNGMDHDNLRDMAETAAEVALGGTSHAAPSSSASS